jgi:hypothetical protein
MTPAGICRHEMQYITLATTSQLRIQLNICEHFFQTSNLDTGTRNYSEYTFNNGPTYETPYSGPSYPISGNHPRQRRLPSLYLHLHPSVSECPTLLNSYTFIPVEYALLLIEVIQRILQFIITVLIFRNERESISTFPPYTRSSPPPLVKTCRDKIATQNTFEKPEKFLSVIFPPELHLFRHVCEQAVLMVI